MKYKNLVKIVLLMSLFLLTGCEKNQEETDLEETEFDFATTSETASKQETILPTSELDTTITSDSEALLDAFLASKIPAVINSEHDVTIMFDQLPHDEEDWSCYSVGERIDLDNDGEDEQIVDGPYGGMFLDARDGKVYVFASGEGTAGVLTYTQYDNAVWIVHRDTTHAGRQVYWLTKYDGGETIVDEFTLAAEYWDSPDSKYDENSDFTYRDEKITMKEYEALRKEIIGW